MNIEISHNRKLTYSRLTIRASGKHLLKIANDNVILSDMLKLSEKAISELGILSNSWRGTFTKAPDGNIRLTLVCKEQDKSQTWWLK